MCGLLGILGPGIIDDDLKILKELAYISGLRGQDGAGIAQGRLENFGEDEEKAKRWNKYTINKGYHDITFFQWYNNRHPNGNKELFSGLENNFFAVHVRAATQGRICLENSHPFEFNNIIGMHNGTLVDKKYNSKEKTDSELLIEDIDKRGVVTVLQELNHDSAYALVLIDKRDGKISFVRNKDRSLYCCYNKNRAVMYWASERWMLDGILERNCQKIFDDTIFNFEPFKVHSLYAGDFKNGTSKVFEELEEFVPRAKNDYKDNFSRINWGHQKYTPPEKKGERNLTDILTQEEAEPLLLEHLKDNVKRIPKLHVSNRIPYGTCVDCKKKLNLVDQFFAKKFPLEPSLFICKDCDPPFEPGVITTAENEVKIG